MKNIKYFLIKLLIVLTLPGCEEFLDSKPSKDLVVPVNLMDLSALLDNSSVMNVSPSISLISSDDVFTTESGWLGFRQDWERDAYLWRKEVYEGVTFVPDWSLPYMQVFYANIVLEQLEKINTKPSEQELYNRVMGSALFYRANAFFELSQLYTPFYSWNDKTEGMGIPLKLDADINNWEKRASLQETYDQIASDIKAAAELLPDKPVFPNRPSKQAAYALLARMFLASEEYVQAELYADLSLQINSELIDYSYLASASTMPVPQYVYPIPFDNPEVIYFQQLANDSFHSSELVFVDSTLYNSYHERDLRKQLFFYENFSLGGANFQGSYTGTFMKFSGLAINELYLISAESKARLNKIPEAMSMLNSLLVTRYETSDYMEYMTNSQEEALQIILIERRKELLFRGTNRWSDLRRLNRDPRFAVTLERSIGDKNATLIPGDSRYVLPIPEVELDYNDLEQNP
ncbi:RagB/SusD family nutrient uptake outer membrane protein [Belliella sp. DSM 111904]|uniref:RagB/SusD family nutrient uptake outer membrane protein n=1 Tax=Belliella filtrata TaxID=2923435 RepID=A0ABS9V2T2_9BACT|nr:RagB/SusD family nutrient uptake outer membrane protein [Belliella filtrata]MCH7410691.1 RagB/SusD family nutrient uptake outer membrane protein [Belliella filtrata]